MKKFAIDVDEDKAESKWEHDTVSMSPKDVFNFANSSLTNMSIQTSPQTGKMQASMSFDDQYSRQKRSTLIDSVTSHLEEAGLNAEIEASPYNEREFSVTMKDCEAGDLARLASALSATRDLGKGQTIYPVIPQGLENAVASEEAKSLGQTNAYTVSEFTMEREGEKSRTYVDYESHLPEAPIQQIKESSELFDPNDPKSSIQTEIFMGGNANQAAIIQTLKGEGLQAHKAGENVVVKQSTSSDVAGVLSKKGFMPDAASEGMKKLDTARGAPQPWTAKTVSPNVTHSSNSL